MVAKILDGKRVAAEIRSEVKKELDRWQYIDQNATFREVRPNYRPPCLAVVLASDDPASEIYVQKKQEACEKVGITSFLVRPFGGKSLEQWSNPQQHLLDTVDWLNRDDSIHGILVQLPLVPGLNQYGVFDRINPLKDVDVFVPENVGLLLQGRPRYTPCTPAAVQELLVRHGIQIKGRKVCIVNRSDVVGKPLHAVLVQNSDDANATVTVCHDHTPPALLAECCRTADIVVVAVGKPEFLGAEMVSDGAVVVDVGINRVAGSVVGDVDRSMIYQAGWLSPVPGGVGPVTVACLLRNTVQAWKLFRKEK